MHIKYSNIEAERARLGFTKEAFAKKLNVATKTYYNWINGTNPIPSDVLINMSRICDAKIDYLLETDEDSNKEVSWGGRKMQEMYKDIKTSVSLEGIEEINALFKEIEELTSTLEDKTRRLCGLAYRLQLKFEFTAPNDSCNND